MSVPSCRRHVLHVPVRSLHEGEGCVRSVRLDHMREACGALVCAEGETPVVTLPEGSLGFYCVDDRIIALLPSGDRVQLLSNGHVYILEEGLEEGLLRIVNNLDVNGNDAITAICNGGVYQFSNIGVTSAEYKPAPSTTNIVLHRERLFGAAGRRICYTKRLNFKSWTQYGEQDAGWCDLLPDGGDVVDVVAMRDRVYFLREYGITRFTGYADVYNFRLDDLPYGMGKIISRAAVLGGCAYFFTECGLCRFDGTSAEPAPGAADGEIDLSQPVRAEQAGETMLAASVTLKDGSAALYVYEPVCGRGRFVRRAYEKIAGGNAVNLMRNGAVYRLGGRALPDSGCSLTVRFALGDLGDGEKRLEALRIAGEGSVRAEASGEDGTVRSCTGKAGEWLDFAAGVRGETVTVRIDSEDEAVRILSLTLRIRREERL